MRHFIYLSTLLLSLAVMTGCTDDFEYDAQPTLNYRGEPVDAFLNIKVGALLVSMDTRADVYDPYEDTEAERWVNDMWIFQFDADTQEAVAEPQYLTIDIQEQLEEVPVRLSNNEGSPSLIYVVTNTGDPTWATTETDFATVEQLLADALPTHEPIFVTAETEPGDLSIPMEGNSGEVTVVANKVITVPVERMYAKLMIAEPVSNIYVTVDNEQGTSSRVKAETEVYSVGVGNIPLYCRVGTLWDGTGENGAEYPEHVQWISRYFEASLDTINKSGIVQPDADTDGNTYYPYVVYVPENLQGTAGVQDTLKLHQEEDAPAHALQLNVVITVHSPTDGAETQYPYTFYPGANTTTDYNIRRNNVYRVKTEIDGLSIERVPSANCFVGIEGHTISFFPYYRVETGGGYDFSSYLDPLGESDAQTNAGAKIDHVGIVWQTEDCIGDNSDGSLVYLTNERGTKIDSKTAHNGYEQIHVHASKEGNALIAAYDTEENILWSWHIWVRTEENGDPTHPANALVYYTYDWDENGVKGLYQGYTDRVAGYEIMSCNLGALQDKPNWAYCTHLGDSLSDASTHCQTFDEGDGIVRTFGMLYQWGRKDPFPPMTSTSGALGNGNNSSYAGQGTGFYTHDYDDAHTDVHYGNDNTTVVHKTAYGPEGPTYTRGNPTKYDSYLFYTHIHNSADGITGMRYSIAHPTVFLSGVYEIGRTLRSAYGETGSTTARADSTNYVKLIDNYIWGGAWSDEDHDNREWGGLEPNESTKSYKLPDSYTYDDGESIWLYDDYGTDKSIFDPCPYGWRVGSGDLWLGFTKSGINTWYDPADNTVVGEAGEYGSLDNVNFDINYSCFLGLSMYLGNGWRTGETSWFPTQGFRLPDGCGYRVGGCGNYVNANTGANDRVNIIHIHCSYEYFKQFETQLFYTVKSSGNPLRCVRDSK